MTARAQKVNINDQFSIEISATETETLAHNQVENKLFAKASLGQN